MIDPRVASPLAIFSSLAISEIALIVIVALMVFGGRLPEVAMRAAAQLVRARKVVQRMWREAGLEQELRKVQWEIERNMPRDTDYSVRPARRSEPPAVRATHHPEEGLEHLAAPPGTMAVGAPEVERPAGPDPEPPPPDDPTRPHPGADPAGST